MNCHTFLYAFAMHIQYLIQVNKILNIFCENDTVNKILNIFCGYDRISYSWPSLQAKEIRIPWHAKMLNKFA